MAERSDESNVAFPAIAAVLGGALLGWIYHVTPLETTRPAAPPSRQQVLGEQVVPARLWQDPFSACEQQRSESAPPKGAVLTASDGGAIDDLKELRAIGAQITRRQRTNGHPLILPVMVSNAPYADQAEWRLRARYAMLSALGAAGYQPAEQAHVGRFSIPWMTDAQIRNCLHPPRQHYVNQLVDAAEKPTDISASGDSTNWDSLLHFKTPGSRLVVPYEWFERDKVSKRPPNGTFDSVLVLWLDNDMLGFSPVLRMGQLLEALGEAAGNPAKLDVRVIGPDDSTTLQAMIEDSLVSRKSDDTAWADRSNSGPGKRLRDCLRGVVWYAAHPTASAPLLLNSAQTANVATCGREILWYDGGSAPSNLPGNAGEADDRSIIKVIRTVCSDDVLLQEMVRELSRRGVDLSDSRNHIGLVCEWDSFYGRAMAKTFVSALHSNCLEGSCLDLPPVALKPQAFDEEGKDPRVEIFSYLAGIDGVSSRDAEQRAEAAKSKDSNDARGDQKQPQMIERPDGASQFDYMRRIAGKLEERSRVLWRSGETYAAIGVVGGDTYDKLLVLQALRDSFPDALFFTTDLDNRLLDPDRLKWTRNLLVASSFGLSLEQSWQDRIPPFRDAYQTAMFASCQEALNVFNNPTIYPRMFEVGRWGAFDISPEYKTTAGIQIQAPRPPRFTRSYIAYEVALIVLVFIPGVLLLASRSSRSLREILSSIRNSSRKKAVNPVLQPALDEAASSRSTEASHLALLALVYALCVAGLLVSIRLSFDIGRGKPFALAQGVSLWPTEIMRISAAFIAIAFLIHAHHSQHRNKIRLGVRYGLKLPHYRGFLGQLARRIKKTRSVIKGLILSWRRREKISLMKWDEKCLEYARQVRMSPPGLKPPIQPRAGVEKLWREYLKLGTNSARYARVLPLVGLLLLLGWMLTAFLGRPLRPTREWWSNFADQFSLWPAVLALMLLTYFVVDAIRLCQIFCENLAGEKTPWPEETLEDFAATRCLPKEYAEEWLDMELIADRTAVIGKLIFYPFIVLAIMIASRNELFDRFSWSFSLVLVLGLLCLYAIWCVLLLRGAAEGARQAALKRLGEKLVALHGTRSKAADKRIDAKERQIELLIEEIKSYSKGAFAPLSQHPVAGAILIPLGGAGSLSLIQFLTTGKY